MKVISLLLLTAIGIAAHGQSISFKLWNCQNILKEYSIQHDSFKAKGLGFKIDTVLSKKDSDSLQALFNLILQTPGDEAWLNNCVNDGTHLKFVLTTHDRQKKVYVGNYYDARLNSIALILNAYLTATSTQLRTISYGTTDQEVIRQKIEAQNDCQEASVKVMDSRLYKWCER